MAGFAPENRGGKVIIVQLNRAGKGTGSTKGWKNQGQLQAVESSSFSLLLSSPRCSPHGGQIPARTLRANILSFSLALASQREIKRLVTKLACAVCAAKALLTVEGPGGLVAPSKSADSVHDSIIFQKLITHVGYRREAARIL